MSKINHTKKVIEDLNVFRKYFRARKNVGDENQKSISFIKAELQNFIKNNISFRKERKKIFWFDRYGPYLRR